MAKGGSPGERSHHCASCCREMQCVLRRAHGLELGFAPILAGTIQSTKYTKDTKGCGSGALSGVPTDLPAAPNGSPHLRVRAGLEASPFRAFRVFRGLFICIAPAERPLAWRRSRMAAGRVKISARPAPPSDPQEFSHSLPSLGTPLGVLHLLVESAEPKNGNGWPAKDAKGREKMEW